ncbi:MAG: SDR family oxidoreductase [Clostridiales bacterium]|nr:SDR family oxidoreductase [Clostridiales bacterium]
MIAPGTVVLITGGGKGVGAGIGRVLCAAGAKACLGYRSSPELAEKTLGGILGAGGDAFLYRADVADRAQLRAMVEATVAKYGRLDALVNNAAMQPNRFIGEYDADHLTALFEINAHGYLRALQECLPYLKKSACPRIVNISSVHGKRPAVFDVGYSMTKSAIRMLTREAALEFAKYGITVNCIDLGACKIEGKTGGFPFRMWWPPETRPHPGQPLGRITTPEDVGHLVQFLLSPEAGNLDGAGIRLDGAAMLT